jgi:hypothetical protein
MLLVFEPQLKGAPRPVPLPADSAAVALGGPWQLRLEHVSGERREMPLPRLIDFKEDDRLKSFAGVAVYQTSFAAAPGIAFLDLGTAFRPSRSTVNRWG